MAEVTRETIVTIDALQKELDFWINLYLVAVRNYNFEDTEPELKQAKNKIDELQVLLLKHKDNS